MDDTKLCNERLRALLLKLGRANDRISELEAVCSAGQENLDHAINENRKAKQRIRELERVIYNCCDPMDATEEDAAVIEEIARRVLP